MVRAHRADRIPHTRGDRAVRILPGGLVREGPFGAHRQLAGRGRPDPRTDPHGYLPGPARRRRRDEQGVLRGEQGPAAPVVRAEAWAARNRMLSEWNELPEV